MTESVWCSINTQNTVYFQRSLVNQQTQWELAQLRLGVRLEGVNGFNGTEGVAKLIKGHRGRKHSPVLVVTWDGNAKCERMARRKNVELGDDVAMGAKENRTEFGRKRICSY
jgi:hypothetical protein